MPAPATTKTPSVSELIEATAAPSAKPASEPQLPTMEEQAVTTLKTHYTARKAAMRSAFEIMQGLDDGARQNVFTALADGSQAVLEQDLATFKLRLARLLKIPAARAAEVK